MDLTAWMQTLAFTDIPHAAGKRKHYGYDCSRSRHGWPAMPTDSTCLPAHIPFTSLALTAFTRLAAPLKSLNPPLRPGKTHSRARGTQQPTRCSGRYRCPNCRTTTPKTDRTDQHNLRKIEANEVLTLLARREDRLKAIRESISTLAPVAAVRGRRQ